MVVAVVDEVESAGSEATPVNHSPLATATAGIPGFEAAKVSTPEYDLVVIGSGPAGQKAAIAAAKASSLLLQRTAVDYRASDSAV